MSPMRCIIDHREQCSYFRKKMTNKRRFFSLLLCLRVKDSHTLSFYDRILQLRTYHGTNKLGKTRSYGYLPYHPFSPPRHIQHHTLLGWERSLNSVCRPKREGSWVAQKQATQDQVKNPLRPGSTSLPAEVLHWRTRMKIERMFGNHLDILL